MSQAKASLRSRMRPQVTRGATAAKPCADRWVVPLHLRGLACQACGYFFQDGESHGVLDLATGEVTCRTRTVAMFAKGTATPGQGL